MSTFSLSRLVLWPKKFGAGASATSPSVTASQVIREIAHSQSPDQVLWHHLSTHYPEVYNAFQIVQDANPSLVPCVLCVSDKNWYFILTMDPSGGYPDRAHSVAVGYNNGVFYKYPQSAYEVNSPATAIASIFKQAEFREHIAFVQNGMGLDGCARFKIVPGKRATRRGMRALSLDHLHQLTTG